MLPDLTGFELTRRIRKDDPAAKIVMLSVSEDPAFVVRAVAMGIQGYVSKSDDPRLLVKAIRKVAAGGALRLTTSGGSDDFCGRGDQGQSFDADEPT